jgi:hypothetical protein
MNKTKEEIELDVLKFLSYFKDKFITSATYYDNAINSEIPYDILVNNLTCIFVRGVIES